SSANSYFGTLDEESDEETTTTTSTMTSSQPEPGTSGGEVILHRQEKVVAEEDESYHRSPSPSVSATAHHQRRVYARSISFAGTRSYSTSYGGGPKWHLPPHLNFSSRRGL